MEREVMTINEQIAHFGDELDRLIDRLRDEYDLPYAAVVGTLQMKAHLIMVEASERDPGDTEKEE